MKTAPGVGVKNFSNKVAVVTGAASGIGKGIAGLCVRRGMKVVLADIEADALRRTAGEFDSDAVEAVQVDVSSYEQVQALAATAVDRFGSVDLLVNNAGVSSPGSPWETTIDDWNWVMGVNLWGVIYGIRAFMPTMIRQQSPCHIVNTASAAGLVYGNGPATYATTKHAVVGLTEDLYFHVNRRGLDIGVSVLCPGLISTNIVDSARNRPEELGNRFEPGTSEQRTLNQARLAEAMQTAMTPAELAEIVFAAIADRRLYIQTGESNEIILARARHITSGSNP